MIQALFLSSLREMHPRGPSLDTHHRKPFPPGSKALYKLPIRLCGLTLIALLVLDIIDVLLFKF